MHVNFDDEKKKEDNKRKKEKSDNLGDSETKQFKKYEKEIKNVMRDKS